MTYSIVARDPATGALGVAGQTCVMSVGATVTWAEAGVGAIATQSMAEISFGPRGLDLMRGGASAADALAELVASDDDAETRQVGVIDASGHGAAFTGKMCLRDAGHVIGDGFTTQANMMLRDTVWDAMARAYVASSGPLAYRLLAALSAAQAEGGDLRGQQSAAMLIVEGARADKPAHGKLLDVRVDDAPEPLAELRRLVDLDQPNGLLRAAYHHLTALELDAACALADEAVGLNPSLLDAVLVAGGIRVATGREADAHAAFARYAGDREVLRRYAVRYAETGMFPLDPDAIARAIDGA